MGEFYLSPAFRCTARTSISRRMASSSSPSLSAASTTGALVFLVVERPRGGRPDHEQGAARHSRGFQLRECHKFEDSREFLSKPKRRHRRRSQAATLDGDGGGDGGSQANGSRRCAMRG